MNFPWPFHRRRKPKAALPARPHVLPLEAAPVQAPTIQSLLTTPGIYQQYQDWSGYGASENLLAVLKQVLVNQDVISAGQKALADNQQILLNNQMALSRGVNAILAAVDAANKPLPAVALILSVKEPKMPLVLKDNQQVTYTATPVDAKGNPTTDPNPLAWSSSDPTVLAATPSADGLSCNFVAVKPGAAQVQVSDGTLSGTDDVTVTPGDVASLAISAGTPADQ